jgi:REP element-mobilizing transposase RayT
MPRLARLDAPGVLHHIIGRGIERRKIFYRDKDREDFVDRLAELAEKGAWTVYAWTLMPNHYHLLIKTKNQPLADNMRKLLTGYAVNFNRRHKRAGHLFQNRYKSIVCQEENYLRELVRYLHLNPLRAGLVQDMKQLNRYPWSGHSALVGRVKQEWQDTGYVLSIFGDGLRARRNYLAYVMEGIARGRRPDLVGGGLIRSLGGWSEVLALRSHKEKVPYDQRILGDGDFVQRLQSAVDDVIQRSRKSTGQTMNLETLTEQTGSKYGLLPGEIRSGGRRREAVRARGEIALAAERELGYSGADVARYLGVTTSCINRVVGAAK